MQGKNAQIQKCEIMDEYVMLFFIYIYIYINTLKSKKHKSLAGIIY